MTDTIKQKALALVNEVAKEMGLVQLRILDTDLPGERALCRVIEQHEAFRQEVSKLIEDWWYQETPPLPFRRFIITKPDPLVEAWDEAMNADTYTEDRLSVFRAAIKKRGGKIVWGEG